MAMKKIRPIRIQGNIAFIPLTKGYEAIVDVSDLPLVGERNWFATEIRKPDGSIYAVYATRTDVTDGRKHNVHMHRLIAPPATGLHVDHISGDGLDNRRSNLREVTRSQNMMNRRGNAGSRSGVKGVYWLARTGRWYAQIQANGKRWHLGYFPTMDDAVSAYRMANIEKHGEFGKF